MYAIIDTCGKQYRVQEGDVIFVDRLAVSEGELVTFDKVLALSDDNGLKVGNPVEGASVTGVVLRNARAKKIMVFKYKAKKTYRRSRGHRQPYSKVQIQTINV